MLDSNSVNCYTESLRQRVFALLNEYPWLTAKNICRILKLQYKQHCAYVNNLKYSWKSNHKNERGSICSSVHGWRGYFCVPYFVRRDLAVDVGWILSKARNRWLLWKDKLGRMMWFETGRVELYVRQPANLGKAKQLICNGFTKTGLIEGIREFDQVLASLKFRGAHYVFDSGYPLPKMTIDAFTKSNGITIKVGDKSHPRAVEVISRYPDWAERNEQFLKEIKRLFIANFTEKEFTRKLDYVA